jgi:hypothetical protein
VLMSVRALDEHAAAGDAVVEALQPQRAFANHGVERVGRSTLRNVACSDSFMRAPHVGNTPKRVRFVRRRDRRPRRGQ